jgi:hypothetical protein
LTDPYYFDFISFAQYATINREITLDPPFVFEEQQPVDVGEDEPQKFVATVVRRDSTLTNDKLASEHSRLVGSAILDRLEEIFGDTPARLPRLESGSRPSSGKCRVPRFIIYGFSWSMHPHPTRVYPTSFNRFCKLSAKVLESLSS